MEIKNGDLSKKIAKKEERINNLLVYKNKHINELDAKLLKLKNAITEKKNTINKLIIEKNLSNNENKYILWEYFLKSVQIKTSKENFEKLEKFIFSEQDLIVLKKDAPYKILNKFFVNLKYSTNSTNSINKNLFNEFKYFIIENIQQEKNNLTYNVSIKNLIKLKSKSQKEMNQEIINMNRATKLEEKWKSIDKQSVIRNIYDKTINSEYKKCNKIIYNFITNTSIKYIKRLNLKYKPKNNIYIEGRESYLNNSNTWK